MDKMDNLIEKINELEASLKDINFKIDNFKPFEKNKFKHDKRYSGIYKKYFSAFS